MYHTRSTVHRAHHAAGTVSCSTSWPWLQTEPRCSSWCPSQSPPHILPLPYPIFHQRLFPSQEPIWSLLSMRTRGTWTGGECGGEISCSYGDGTGFWRSVPPPTPVLSLQLSTLECMCVGSNPSPHKRPTEPFPGAEIRRPWSLTKPRDPWSMRHAVPVNGCPDLAFQGKEAWWVLAVQQS